MVGRIGAAIAAFVVLAAVGTAAVRVGSHEDHEIRSGERHTLLELEGEDSSTASSVRLTTVHLIREQEVIFEICSSDRMEPSRWEDRVAFAIWRPGTQELMTRTEMSAAILGHAARDETHACLVIGRGVIGETDDYAIEALWEGERPEALEDVQLVARVQGKVPLSDMDRLTVVGAWLSSLLLVLFLFAVGRREDVAEPEVLDEWEEAQEAASPPRRLPPEARVGIGFLVVLSAFSAAPYLGVGAVPGLIVGLALAVVESLAAFGLIEGRGLAQRMRGLALVRPKRWYFWILGAVVSGYLLVHLARLSTLLVPSTGRSAIQSLVSMPSGMLSFACLAVVAPFAEELFFRGLVYGELAKRHRALGFVAGWLLFVGMHGSQTWGQWGALVAIGVTGLGLTTLRAASRSTLVPAVAHLVYNGTLALAAVLPS